MRCHGRPGVLARCARLLSLFALLTTGLFPHEAKAELVRVSMRPAAPATTVANPDGSDDDSFSRKTIRRSRRPARLARLAPPRPEPESRLVVARLPRSIRAAPPRSVPPGALDGPPGALAGFAAPDHGRGPPAS